MEKKTRLGVFVRTIGGGARGSHWLRPALFRPSTRLDSTKPSFLIPSRRISRMRVHFFPLPCLPRLLALAATHRFTYDRLKGIGKMEEAVRSRRSLHLSPTDRQTDRHTELCGSRAVPHISRLPSLDSVRARIGLDRPRTGTDHGQG